MRLSQITRFTPAPLALATAITLAFAASHAPHVRAQTESATAKVMSIDIPAQSLASALNELASQADLQMTYSATSVAGRTAPAVSGQLSATQALDRLLAGSGFMAVSDGTSILIRTTPDAVPQHQSQSSLNRTTLAEVEVIGTAEEALKQAPGVSIISRQDIEKRPPANDLADLVRTMPGVNLTGNSSTGQYGNNRQIDLRGMGPENTLILIDGVPVSSRNSIRMGRSGERNTRGDSNWVPAEAVESIEVLRGPAAARYGSGAAGGVVNILTKRPTEQLSGSVTYYTNRPQSSDEQDTSRVGVNLAGPLGDQLSFRFYGSANKTDADAITLNQAFSTGDTPPAGREGVRNRDANLLLRWDLTDEQVLEFTTGFSRQGNIYAGDRALNFSSPLTTDLAAAGVETNTLYRRTASVVHRGKWGEGRTSRLALAYEGTDNHRMDETLSGGQEGSIAQTQTASTSELKNWLLNGEFNTPLRLGGPQQMLTVGFDLKNENLNDPYTMTTVNAAVGARAGRSSTAEATSWALFVEDNIQLTDKWLLTPGLRFDRHDQFGSNVSPSLNTSYQWTSDITLKGGIARAFKAPNLYQSNPNYLWQTNGNGCPINWPRPNSAGCLILGNPDLKPEISINKEIGIAYEREGWGAGLTYFRNDYDNKIVTDLPDQVPVLVGNSYLFNWVNADKAIVRGVEGHFTMPILGEDGSRLKWINNFTYMIENKNRKTGQSLATVPDYTINSSLDWQATDQLSLMLTATFYGAQAPRTRAVNGSPAIGVATNVRKAYHLLGASAGYSFNRNLRARVGISNLFDKRLFREHNQAGAGAATYNEAGRAIYATVTASF